MVRFLLSLQRHFNLVKFFHQGQKNVGDSPIRRGQSLVLFGSVVPRWHVGLSLE